MHGGNSKGPKSTEHNTVLKQARTHGIYDAYYTEEEKDLDLHLRIGSVVAEMELCRIRIRRIVKQMREWEEVSKTSNEDLKEQFAELESVTRQTGERPVGDSMSPFENETKVRKRPDFEAMLQRYLGRIESLEKTQKELTGGAGGGTAEDIARSILEEVAEMDDSVPDVQEPSTDVPD